MIELARRLAYDVRTWPEEMGLALGQGEVTPLEQARFVATVARGGKLASGRPVVMATDPSGQVRIPEVEPGTQVLSPEGAALTRDLMRLVIEVGTGGGARGTGGFAGYAGPAIGKTGTTDLEKDLWFIGASPTFASAVWLGYDQPRRIGASASDLAAPLWGWWNNALHTGLPTKEFEGVKTTPVGICRVSGKRSNGSCPMIGAPFLSGTAPKGACPVAHPPPDPNAPPKEHESLWKRRAREAEERAAAEAGAAAPPTTTP
jgi:penicillin-binding protein 1A